MKRGGGIVTLSLDVEPGQAGYAPRPVEALTPEDEFERLKQYLTSDAAQDPYEETAEGMGISIGAVATAVHRLRERYGKCLRAEIATTVVDPEEIDNELRHLLDLIRS